MKLKIQYTLILILVFGFAAAKTYQLSYPSYFPTPLYPFAKNPLDSATVDLGRALFYDPILSKDSSISCASCHSPFNAFAHTDHKLSHGIHDSIGTRNAPALFNLAWQSDFMWDGAISDLDKQALAPITHAAEMGENLPQVMRKLNSSPMYKTLFLKAFGQKNIETEHLLKALAQFQLTLVSANSKYDQVRQNKASFTQQEVNGYALFQKNCNACHREPLFTNAGFANNGLPLDESLKDMGRMKTTLRSADSLKFKVPSLRNLSYSFPYMHDGRFKNLSEVIQHYSKNVQAHPTLDIELQKPMRLTSNDKVDLIAFLLTLNDQEFVFNPRHQFPKEILLPAREEGK